MQKKQGAILSTAYFPPIEYFAYIVMNEEVTIDLNETYPKQTYRNRCVILSANGPLNLSIPVKRIHGNHTKTKEILLGIDEPWQLKHERALEAAYKSSPFYDYYIHQLKPVFTTSTQSLAELNMSALVTTFEILQLKKVIHLAKNYEKSPESVHDLRTAFSPKSNQKRIDFPHYQQVFSDRHPFHANLSILDLLFNEGPQSLSYITRLAKLIQDKQS